MADTELSVTNIAGTTRGSASETLTGFTVGGGIESKLSQSLSLGAEFLYMDFDEEHFNLLNLTPADSAGVDADLNLHVVRAFLNLRF